MEKAQINKGKIALYILNFILSCLIIRFYNIPLFFTIPLSFVFSASAFFAVKRGIERRELKGNLIFSACISASVVIGRHVNLSGGGINRFNICDLIIFSALTLMHLYFSFVASKLYGCMIRKEGKINLNWFHYTLLWFSIFGTWFFCLGINFPGNISYDSIANIQMATGKINLTNHHPIVYTLAIRMFFGIGKVFGLSVNCIVAAFLAVQAAMMALIVTHMIGWLYKRTSNMLFLFGITGFFIINPVFSFYAVHMWKDIPFSYCLIEYILCIYEITEKGGKNLGNIKFEIRYLIFMVLVCFFRNNGIYIVLLSSAVLFIVYKKSVRNTMLIIGATILIQGPIYSILGIEHSEFVESIGRSLQQVSYTIRVGGQLEEEQKKFLENIMPLSEWGGVYDPVSADPIKWAKGFDNEFLETHKKEFIRIYFEMFLQNPKEYMEAFIAGTLGFWNYEQSTWVICAWGPVEAALETGIQSDQGIFEWNRIRYNESVGVLQSEIPLVKLILRGGFLFWMAFFIAVRVIVEREYKKLLPLLPLFGLWATLIIASPLYSSFRYMFSFEIAIPIFLYMFLYSTKSRRIGAKG